MKWFAITLLFCILANILQAQNRPPEPNTPYVFPEFRQGVLFYSGDRHKEALLNYHKVQDQMVLAQEKMRIPLDQIDRLDSIRIDRHLFTKIDGKWLEKRNILESHLLIRYHATTQIEAKEGAYGTKSHSTQVDEITIGDQIAGNYDLIWSEEYKFQTHNDYFFVKEGVLHKANNLSQVVKIFPEFKKQIKQYASEKGLDFKEVDQVHELFLYCSGM